MTVCDLTHAYHPTSGGIRTFIDLKRRYLLEHTPQPGKRRRPDHHRDQEQHVGHRALCRGRSIRGGLRRLSHRSFTGAMSYRLKFRDLQDNDARVKHEINCHTIESASWHAR